VLPCAGKGAETDAQDEEPPGQSQGFRWPWGHADWGLFLPQNVGKTPSQAEYGIQQHHTSLTKHWLMVWGASGLGDKKPYTNIVKADLKQKEAYQHGLQKYLREEHRHRTKPATRL